MFLAEKSVVLTFSVLLLVATNVNYTMYHLYMRQNKEFSSRLLNKLHQQMGAWSQIGSAINFLLVLKGLEIFDFGYIGEIKHFQLPFIVFSFLKISVAHNIRLYKSELYLDLGTRLSNLHLLFGLTLLRYQWNVIDLFSKCILFISLTSNGIAYLGCVEENYDESCLDQKLNITNRIFGIMSVIFYSLQWLILGIKMLKVIS